MPTFQSCNYPSNADSIRKTISPPGALCQNFVAKVYSSSGAGRATTTWECSARKRRFPPPCSTIGFSTRSKGRTSKNAPARLLPGKPREEHLLPLMVAVGAAERDVATRFYHEDTFFGSGNVSSFMFT